MGNIGKESPKEAPLVVILVSIIGCLGLIIASAIGIIPEMIDRIPTAASSPTSQMLPTGTAVLIVENTTTITSTATEVIPTSTVNSVECVHPQELANQKGWLNPILSDSIYGGFKVSLLIDSDLPELWEANKYNNQNLEVLEKQIFERSSNRDMDAGTWVIYMPKDCRASYGFYK